MRGTIQMIEVGSELPEANLLRMGENGPETVSLCSLTNGRKIVLFGLPGAFTGTCTTAHVPSFIRVMDKLAEKEVAEVVCVTVNDVFVVDAWSESTGAKAAGMSMVADGDGSLTKAFGLDFDAPPVGLYGRSKRYAMVVEDNKVTQFNLEDSPGECSISAGETLLAEMA